jgi:phosphatidylinositol-3-phosphatase
MGLGFLLLGVVAFDAAPPVGGVSNIVVIVMENKEYNQIIGSPSAPYINSLANQYTLLTNSFATTHPSLPNYLSLTGGSTFGITKNCNDCFVNAPNLGDQLEGAGLTWKTYQESMPSTCFLGEAYPYMQKHNGFIYYRNIKDNLARCRSHVVPFSQFASDLNGGKLPKFSLITPNMCNDMHDCSIATGNNWLSKQVPPILSHLGSNGIVVVTFDEGTSDAGCCSVAHGGHVVTIIAGPGAKLKTRITSSVDTYSLLRLIEQNWGLKLLVYAGCTCTPSIAGWQR